MANARNIITLALESMNRLAVGEVVDSDVAAACLRRLNSIADGWNSGRDMMFKDLVTSGTVTGVSVSLSTAPFSAIGIGQEVMQVTADSYPMEPITMQQYNNIYLKTQPGRPQVWAWDGAGTIYIYPAATGNTISIMTREEFHAFADLDTEYAMPSGYAGAFAASLAVEMAPSMIGKVTADLLAARRSALFNIQNNTVRPAIISSNPMARRIFGGTILQGWR